MRGLSIPVAAQLVALSLSLVSGAGAQSTSLEGRDQKDPASEDDRPNAPEPAAPAPPPKVERPRPLNTSISYPQGAKGDHQVVLELLITPEGGVAEARAVEGEKPFTSAAERAARIWRFSPATQDGVPAAARIRFLVTFDQPLVEGDEKEEQATEPPPVAAPSSAAGAAPSTPDAPMEILIEGERKPLRQRMSRAQVKELPGAFGDAFRAIESLPGVVPIVSGVPYFYIRGAPPGNVGYFFDGIPVPVLYHFAAGPGIFHPAFIEQVDLYAGAYPARYGRYTGGIVTGELADPGYRHRGEVSIRLIDSGGMLEAPFANGRGSVMAGGRFSYTGLVISLIAPEVILSYWDYQARAHYAIDRDDSVEVLWFGSGDYVAEVEEDENGEETINPVVNIGFHRLDFRWQRDLPKGDVRTALMLGVDQTRVGDSGEVRFINRMLGARSDLTHSVHEGLQLRSGIDVLYERLSQRIDETEDNVGPREGQPNEPGPGPPPVPPGDPEPENPADPGSEDEGPDSEEFGFSSGRNDFVVGGYTDLVVDVDDDIVVVPGLRSDLFVSGGEVALGIDPRISARIRVAKDVDLTHGLGVVHQMPSFVIPLPGVKPSLRGGLQRALQYSSGVEFQLPSAISASAVVFQNLFFNMTDLIGLAQLTNTGGEVGNFRMRGRGYGFELMLRRSLSRDLGGFLSYTYSRSERMSGRLEGPAATDRSHVANLGLSQDLGLGWRAGGRVLFYTGIPARVAYLAAARNPPRTPPFWRLDLRLQKRWLIGDGPSYVGLIFEVLNTTLNEEVVERSCNAYVCADERIGPVTLPSIGVEGAL